MEDLKSTMQSSIIFLKSTLNQTFIRSITLEKQEIINRGTLNRLSLQAVFALDMDLTSCNALNSYLIASMSALKNVPCLTFF